METRDPPVLLAHELEVGRRYGVVLSGANGLYRYDLNDVVEVQGRHHRAPLLAFVRKGRDMTSITGEKLHVNHVRDAVRQAEDATRVEVWQYRLIPTSTRAATTSWWSPARPASTPSAPRRSRAPSTRGSAASTWSRREAADAPARRAAARRHAPGLGRAAVPGRVRAGAARRPHKWRALVADWDPASRAAVIRTWEVRRHEASGGIRIGQALLLWVAVGGPILLWCPRPCGSRALAVSRWAC